MSLLGALGAAGISGGASLLTNYMNNQFAASESKKANQFNYLMWNLANEYNSPKNQMARLKEAGLNPNLVYGNGSVVGNTTTSTPTYNKNSVMPYSDLALLTGMNAYQEFKNKEEQNLNMQREGMRTMAQVDVLNSQVRNLAQEHSNMRAQENYLTEQTRGLKMENDFFEHIGGSKGLGTQLLSFLGSAGKTLLGRLLR